MERKWAIPKYPGDSLTRKMERTKEMMRNSFEMRERFNFSTGNDEIFECRILTSGVEGETTDH